MRRAFVRATPLLATLALAVGLAGCPKKDKEDPDANVVATVNGEVLARADFELELGRELASTEAPQRTPEEVEPFKRALLDTLISAHGAAAGGPDAQRHGDARGGGPGGAAAVE